MDANRDADKYTIVDPNGSTEDVDTYTELDTDWDALRADSDANADDAGTQLPADADEWLGHAYHPVLAVAAGGLVSVAGAGVLAGVGLGAERIAPRDVEPMTLSARAHELGKEYAAFVELYEDPVAYREAGYTPREMELIRRRKHDEYLRELEMCQVDISNRPDTTTLALKMSRWERDE